MEAVIRKDYRFYILPKVRFSFGQKLSKIKKNYFSFWGIWGFVGHWGMNK